MKPPCWIACVTSLNSIAPDRSLSYCWNACCIVVMNLCREAYSSKLICPLLSLSKTLTSIIEVSRENLTVPKDIALNSVAEISPLRSLSTALNAVRNSWSSCGEI